MTDNDVTSGNDEPEYGTNPTEYEMKRPELGPRQGFAPPLEYDPRTEYSSGRPPAIENTLAGWPLDTPGPALPDATTFATEPPADLGIDALLGPATDADPAQEPAEPAQEVAGSAQQFAGPAGEVAGSAREIAGSAQEIAGSAQTVAGSAQDVGGPAGEVAGSARDVGGPAQVLAGQAEDFAKQVAGQAEDFAESSREMPEPAQDMPEQAQQLAGSAQAFGTVPAAEPGISRPFGGQDPIITPVGSGPGPKGPGQQVPPSADDGPALQAALHPKWRRLYHLSMDSRMRIWRRRALITVLAGVVFSIIFTWRLGLTIAVIVAIADTVYRSRTMASIPPGIKLSRAQRRTQRQLTRLERAGYRSLHSRRIPSSEDSIDHLVVGPSGMYAIDSEKWDRRLPIRTRNARQLWHGPHSKKDRLEHAHWEAKQAGELISAAVGTQVTVRPAMAVYGPKVPWEIATIRDVDVFRGSRLRRYFRKRSRASTLPPLAEEEVERIHRAAMVALPLADGSGS